MHARNNIPLTAHQFELCLFKNMNIAGLYFALISADSSTCQGLFLHLRTAFTTDLQPVLQPTQNTSVLFVSELIMSHESDLNCFKGYIC